MTISTHVLDATSGAPAAGVSVTLLDADHVVCDHALTDDDGRIAELRHRDSPGLHRLCFDTGAYFAGRGTAAFYPEVVITFSIDATDAKLHVPLLLSPYSYTTYRGS